MHCVDRNHEAKIIVEGTVLRGSCGMACDPRGRIAVGHVASARISLIDPDSGDVSPLVDVERGVLGTDDITTDGQGTYWATCATGLGGESIFRIDASGAVANLYSNLPGANGIVFDRRSRRLFAGQYVGGNGLYELDPDGRRSPRLISKAFATTNAMDVDHRGRLLVTVDGGRIARVDPDSGGHAFLDVFFPHNSALKVAPDGSLLVSGYSTGAGCLWRVAEDGRSKQVLGEGLLPPLDNLLLTDAGRLFVSSLRDALVIELDPDDGRVLRRFGAGGPATIAAMAVVDGSLLVNDGLSLQTLGPGETRLRMTAGSFYEKKGFPIPGCLDVTAEGRLIMAAGCGFPLTDTMNAKLYSVDPDDFSFDVINRGPFQGVSLPTAILADGPDIHVAEFLAGRIVALDARGDDTRRRVVATDLAGPIGLARIGRRLFIAESLGQRISAVDLDNGRRDVLIAGGIGRPGALAADEQGLIVIDAEGRRLLRVCPVSGHPTVLCEDLPVHPAVVSNWPQVVIANGLAVADGVIHVGGNRDGSIWRVRPR